MTKEEIAKELAKEIYSKSSYAKWELEDIILKKLTEILHADKGRLQKGTITSSINQYSKRRLNYGRK